MYIGIMDDDLRFPKKCYPNLELMKLASFHKYNRDLVELCTDYRQYERYSQIYLGKNLINNDLPDYLLSKARSKCNYTGLFFSNGIYVPMDKEIEEQPPDRTIYDKINFPRTKSFLNRGLARLQTDKCITPVDNHCFFLVYDKDAAHQPLYNELLDTARTVEFIYPQDFSNLEEAMQFASVKQFNKTTIINCNIELTTDVARQIKGENFKNSIHFPYISDKHWNCNTITFYGIVNSLLSEIETLFKICPYIKIQNLPKSNLNTKLIDIINGDFPISGLTPTYDGYEKLDKILPLYPNLFTRITMLRREVDERIKSKRN